MSYSTNLFLDTIRQNKYLFGYATHKVFFKQYKDQDYKKVEEILKEYNKEGRDI